MPPARAIFWAATLAVVVFSVRSAVAGPPPLAVAVAVALAYVALLLAGVLVLRLGVFVDALVRGPASAKGVALTFDDGPHPEHTRKVYPEVGQRIDFKALGYPDDPAITGGRFFLKLGRGTPPQ